MDLLICKKLRVLRAHGSQPKYFHKWVGGNFRMDALQAAVLLAKLPRLDGLERRGRRNWARRLPPRLRAPGARLCR